MAYIAVPIIIAANQARTFDAVYDAGMPAFKNAARDARYGVIDAYPNATPQYEAARTQYIKEVARTVGLVCTAAEARPQDDGRQPELAIGTGLAARGIAAVVRHELTCRIGIMEARYAEGTRRARSRVFTSVYKNGPAEAIAAATGMNRRPESIEDIAWAITDGVATQAGRQLEDMAASEAPTLEAATLAVVEGIIPVQTDIERAIYTELPITWPPQGK
jgi:hypothetical protein